MTRRLVSDRYDLIFAVPEGDEGDIIKQQINLVDSLNVRVVSGDLINVLKRFVSAAADYDKDDIIIRLTADNLIPDHNFVEELIDKYESGYSYAKTNEIAYGVSAEIFKKKHLDEAYENAESSYEKEHVTTYIRDKYYSKSIVHDIDIKDKVRLTLDTYQDYLAINKLFFHFEDIVHASWKDLVNKACEIFPPEKKLMIGTVQFGLDYGIANNTGRVAEKEVTKIIDFASKNSIYAYDTAAEYGVSEKVLGKNMNLLSNSRIITKLRNNIKSKADVENSLLSSCRNLNRTLLDGVLLHKFEQLDSDVWRYLQEYKKQGLAEKIGVSVYSLEEAVAVLREGNSDIIQIPYNILDWRWQEFVEQYSNRIEIYARSIFLQGAILNDKILMKKGFAKILEILDHLVKKFGRVDRIDLCIAYVKSQKSIKHILMGVDNLYQLQQNNAYFNSPDLTDYEIQEVQACFKNTPIALLDIRKW